MKVHEICPILDTSSWKRYQPQQLAEIKSREFFCDATWIMWKQDLDILLSYRKSIKGKPTEEEMIILDMNKSFIQFYKKVLFNDTSK